MLEAILCRISKSARPRFTSSSFGRGLNILDPLRLYLNRGRADFDIRHKIASSIIYDIPAPRFLDRLLGGWQLGAITILQSGPPFTVTCSQPFGAVREDPKNPNSRIIGNSGCDFNADGRSGDTLNAPAFGATKTGLSRSDYM